MRLAPPPTQAALTRATGTAPSCALLRTGLWVWSSEQGKGGREEGGAEAKRLGGPLQCRAGARGRLAALPAALAHGGCLPGRRGWHWVRLCVTVEQDWKEAKHFQTSPALQSCRPMHTLATPASREKFDFSRALPFQKSPPKKNLFLCCYTTRCTQRQLLRKEVKCEKPLKNKSPWEAISVTGDLRVLLDLFPNLNSDTFQWGYFY